MDLSMVIPVKEESENLPELLKEIVAAMEPTGFTYEVIAIDDGSRDNTWEVLETLSHEYPFLSTAARPTLSPSVSRRRRVAMWRPSMATCRMTRSKSRR